MVKYLIFASLLSCISCYGFMSGTDELLTMRKQDNETNNLRLDGYYYYIGNGTDYYDILFYYKNGIFIQKPFIGVKIDKTLDQIDSIFFNDTLRLKTRVLPKDNYGLFKVENEKITTQSWNCRYKCIVYTEMGSIENDTSILINERVEKTGNYKILARNYKFRKFAYKPDSTKMDIYLKSK